VVGLPPPDESAPTLDLVEPGGRHAAQAADIMALGRAAIEAVGRALRSAPEVQAARVLARRAVDLGDLLLELETLADTTPIADLAARLGVSSAALRTAALELQRLGLARVQAEGVGLTATGRQRLARLDAARAAVLRRVAPRLDGLSETDGAQVIAFLHQLVARAEGAVEDNLRRSAPVRDPSGPHRRRASSVGPAAH
jgi:hypothetical protein